MSLLTPRPSPLLQRREPPLPLVLKKAGSSPGLGTTAEPTLLVRALSVWEQASWQGEGKIPSRSCPIPHCYAREPSLPLPATALGKVGPTPLLGNKEKLTLLTGLLMTWLENRAWRSGPTSHLSHDGVFRGKMSPCCLWWWESWTWSHKLLIIYVMFLLKFGSQKENNAVFFPRWSLLISGSYLFILFKYPLSYLINKWIQRQT